MRNNTRFHSYFRPKLISENPNSFRETTAHVCGVATAGWLSKVMSRIHFLQKKSMTCVTFLTKKLRRSDYSQWTKNSKVNIQPMLILVSLRVGNMGVVATTLSDFSLCGFCMLAKIAIRSIYPPFVQILMYL